MTLHMDNPGLSTHARRGMTLLEVVLAMGILVVVSSMTYWFYASTLSTGVKGTDAAYRLRLARVVLDRIATEIRQSSAITADGWVGIRGEPEGIRLSTYRVPSREQTVERTRRDGPRPPEYDLTKVEYKIARHPEILDDDGHEFALGLARVEIPIPRPLPVKPVDREEDQGTPEDGGADKAPESAAAEGMMFDDESGGGASLGPDVNWEELYAPELRYLRFCYFDGHSWWDSWDVSGESPLPQLVQVTIGFTGHPPFGEEMGVRIVNDEFCTCQNEDPVDCVPLAKDQFSAVVRVPQADPLFRSRVSRETQALVEGTGDEDEEDEEGSVE